MTITKQCVESDTSMMLFICIAVVIRKSCDETKQASRLPGHNAIKCAAERGVTTPFPSNRMILLSGQFTLVALIFEVVNPGLWCWKHIMAAPRLALYRERIALLCRWAYATLSILSWNTEGWGIE